MTRPRWDWLKVWEIPRRRRERKRQFHQERVERVRSSLSTTRAQIDAEAEEEQRRTDELIRGLNAEVRMLLASKQPPHGEGQR